MSNSIEIKGLPPVPEGWEFSGEYRQATKGEYLLERGDYWSQWLDSEPSNGRYLIATPIKEASELVRFFECPVWSVVEAVDDIGGAWYGPGTWLEDGCPEHSKEIHPTTIIKSLNGLPIRVDVATGEQTPCDEFGNVLPPNVFYFIPEETNNKDADEIRNHQTAMYTTMIRPVAIRKKVTK
jgi:hypothetical protein